MKIQVIELFFVFILAVAICNAFLTGPLSLSSKQKHLPGGHSHHAPHISKITRFFATTRTFQPPLKPEFDKSVQLSKEMNQMLLKENFLQLPEIVRFVSDGLVMLSDIDELWDSFVGDAAGVTQEESYELLCMVHDLPDPEDMQYYEEQFSVLAKGRSTVALPTLLKWSDVQNLIDDGAITVPELEILFRRAATNGAASSNISIAQFRIFNRLLDDFLDDKEVNLPQQMKIVQPIRDDSSAIGGDIDVWSSSFDPLSVLDEEMVAEYTDYFKANSGSTSGLLSKEAFMTWTDIQELLAEGSITAEALEQAWKEAAGSAQQLSYDRFLRLNVRLDILMDDELEDTEISKDPNSLSDNKSEHAAATNSNEIDLRDRRPNEEVDGSESAQERELAAMLSEDELQLMEALDQADNLLNMGAFGDFDRLSSGAEDPRLAALQPVRPVTATATAGVIGVAPGSAQEREHLQQLVHKVLALSRSVPSCGVGTSAAAGDESSCNEDTDREDDQREAQTASLCSAIQAVIDMAPPLAASRELADVRQGLLGRWRLRYTNSEMCSFYHGVTGFANVIPRAKFSELSVEYASDGYISEGKYHEKITTPLGLLSVTAYTNWDLMKEPSFMTNADSIVLRNYCSKVTVGPFMYEAQENWKSLRALAMNEVMYVDDTVQIVRNCGALGIFFVLEKEL